MGGEFGHPWEWDFRTELPWWLLQHREHDGVRRLIADLNRLYVAEPALHRYEFEPRGFSWLDCNDSDHSTLSYVRWADDRHVIVALNFTPVPRTGYRVGAPYGGRYRVLLNSDSEHYAGSNLGNGLPLVPNRSPVPTTAFAAADPAAAGRGDTGARSTAVAVRGVSTIPSREGETTTHARVDTHFRVVLSRSRRRGIERIDMRTVAVDFSGGLQLGAPQALGVGRAV
jgi:hypothetical protein